MKKIFVQFIVMIISAVSFGQNFEGKITYQNNYTSKIPGATSEQLSLMMGDKQEFFIKDSNYKSTLNGSMLQWQLFESGTNKLYTKMSGSETLLWNDAGVNDDEIIKTEINKNVIEVLGYRCDELILTCKNAVQKFYFNSQLAVDAAIFANHKYGNWYDVISRSNALPLKSIIENPQFTLVSTATMVMPMKLEKSFFELPANSKSEKSPY
ncbi:MAG: hypothetical protein ABIN36_02575 [Ferruginibacter sp.]